MPGLAKAKQVLGSLMRREPRQLALGLKTTVRAVEEAALTLPSGGAGQLALGLETATKFVTEPVLTLPELRPGRLAGVRNRLRGFIGRFRLPVGPVSNSPAEPPPPPPSPAANRPAAVNWRAYAATAAGAALLGGGTVWYLNATRHGRDNRELYRTGPYFF